MNFAMPAIRFRPYCLLAFLPLAAGAALSALAAPETPGTIPSPPTTSQQKSLLLQMQDAFTNIAQTVEPSRRQHQIRAPAQ